MTKENEDGQSVLLFRVSICVLLIGFEILACLVGKLVRENNQKGFGYFFSFCGGILLAKGLVCGIFDSIYTDDRHSVGYSLFLYSSSLVILMAAQMAYKSGAYGYDIVAVDDGDVDDEESLGIELGMLPAADDEDEDDRSRPSKHVNIRDEITPMTRREQSESLLWSYCVISVALLSEGASGMLVGTVEHDALTVYMKIFVQGTLLALVCGAILEESVHDPVEYIRAIGMFVLSMPLGMVSGSYLISWFGFSVNQLIAYAATVYPIAAGCYTAAAMLYILSSKTTSGDDDVSGYAGRTRFSIRPGHIRALCFVAGYAITSFSIQLA